MLDRLRGVKTRMHVTIFSFFMNQLLVLSTNRIPSPLPSPPAEERVPEGRVKGWFKASTRDKSVRRILPLPVVSVLLAALTG